MKYIKSYTRLNESLPPISERDKSIEEIASDVRDILVDVADEYQVLVGTDSGNGITVSIKSESPINLDFVSDGVMHLYDYMKKYQSIFGGNPVIAKVGIGYRFTEHGMMEIVGWGQLDKRNKDAYKRLLDESNIDPIYRILIRWGIK